MLVYSIVTVKRPAKPDRQDFDVDLLTFQLEMDRKNRIRFPPKFDVESLQLDQFGKSALTPTGDSDFITDRWKL